MKMLKKLNDQNGLKSQPQHFHLDSDGSARSRHLNMFR